MDANARVRMSTESVPHHVFNGFLIHSLVKRADKEMDKTLSEKWASTPIMT